MYIHYTHKASAPKTEGTSVDLNYLLQRKERLEQNIQELDAQIAAYIDSVKKHPLVSQGQAIEDQLKNTVRLVEKGREQILQDTDEREVIEVNLHAATTKRLQLRKLIEQVEQGIAELRGVLDQHHAALQKVAVEITRLEEELKGEERKRQAKAKELLAKGVDMTQTLGQQLKCIKREFHNQTHRPAKKARELSRKRDKLQQRLEALEQDIARFTPKDPNKTAQS